MLEVLSDNQWGLPLKREGEPSPLESCSSPPPPSPRVAERERERTRQALLPDHDEGSAVKVPKAAMDQRRMDQIKNEFRVSQRIKDLPNVRALLDVKEDTENLLLCYSQPPPGPAKAQEVTLMEYVKSRGRLEEEEAQAIFGQVAFALFCCHERLVSHRDLKLPSIMIDPENWHVRIADFSHATLLSGKQDLVSDRKGSPAYVSPEILTGNAYSPQASDCWSLGVILYAMLCGTFPFLEANPRSLFEKILKGQVNYPSHLSGRATSLLQGLLYQIPSSRLSLRQALAHPWMDMSFQNDQRVPEL